MAENGEEELIAVARHIAKTLGHTDTMTDDILKIYSNFDGRLREKLCDKFTADGVEQKLRSLDREISRYVSSDWPIWSNSADFASFLDLVDQLTTAVREWSTVIGDKSVSGLLGRAEELLQQAMSRLQDELRTLVERGGESYVLTKSDSVYPPAGFSDDEYDEMLEEDDFIPVAQPVTNYNIIIDALPAGTIGELNEIAKRMVAAGYVKECSHAYSTGRWEFLDESFYRLGLQKLSTDEIHRMQWNQMADEIEKWIKAINVAVRILFPSERRLCDRVFKGLSSAADLSFMEVCRDSTIQLLDFADAVAIGSRAPDKLFKVLDVYEAMRDLIPEFQQVFSDKYCIPFANDAIAIWKKLGETVKGIFMELENCIRRDPAKEIVDGGGLHPITRYVMNYLRVACKTPQTLEQIFDESVGFRKGSNQVISSPDSVAMQLTWILELLESNLEAKSKVYKDPALCSIFMMNNGRYILQKVKDNELGTFLGEDWIRKHTAKVRLYHVNYQRSSWTKVLSILRADDISLSPTEAFSRYTEKLKKFNSEFEKTCQTQLSWVASDDQTREELRVSISGALCPAYRNFISRFQNVVDSGKHADRYIRYSVDEIEFRIRELFQGGRTLLRR